MDICMIIGHILFLAGIIFSIMTLIKRSDEPRNFIYAFIACICFFGSIVLLATNLCQKKQESRNRSTFYYHEKLRRLHICR